MKFVKYDITFETEREVFISYGKTQNSSFLVKFNHVTFIEDTCVQELDFKHGEETLIYMIKRGSFLNDILNSVLKNEKVIILRKNIHFFNCNSDAVYFVES